jgi:hypothetical protein
LTAEGKSARPQHEIPYLHVRPPRRVVGVGGEGAPDAPITGRNRAGLLKLRDQIDRALGAEDGMAVVAYGYREVDGSRFDVTVRRTTKPEEMGEPREPERPDRSMFT